MEHVLFFKLTSADVQCCRSRLVTAFHRLAVWPHMCVSDTNAAHKEPLVAALYNNTFQVVSPALANRQTYSVSTAA